MKRCLVFRPILACLFFVFGFQVQAETSIKFREELVIASLAADSLCLGPHWIYDIDEIKEIYPDGITQLDAPRSRYHPGKSKGDLTHYGDQGLLLLEVIAEEQQWSLAAWKRSWETFWRSAPPSYLDSATRDTLENWANGKPIPSDSHDLAGASRMAPLLALLHDQPLERVVAAARDQSDLTHGNSSVGDSAEFFTRMIWEVREGSGYKSAIAKALESGSYTSNFEKDYIITSTNDHQTSEEAAEHFGQSCDVYHALPLTLWLALTYEDDPVELLRQNALIGGDSSARGMLLAMLVAASGDFSKLPSKWTDDLKSLPRIEAALAKLP